jgi:hypothetical protein
MKKKIEKLIKDHVQHMRRHYPWDGEHEAVVKEIMKIIKENG